MEDKKTAHFASNMSEGNNDFNIEDILFNDFDSKMANEEDKKDDPNPPFSFEKVY